MRTKTLAELYEQEVVHPSPAPSSWAGGNDTLKALFFEIATCDSFIAGSVQSYFEVGASAARLDVVERASDDLSYVLERLHTFLRSNKDETLYQKRYRDRALIVHRMAELLKEELSG